MFFHWKMFFEIIWSFNYLIQLNPLKEQSSCFSCGFNDFAFIHTFWKDFFARKCHFHRVQVNSNICECAHSPCTWFRLDYLAPGMKHLYPPFRTWKKPIVTRLQTMLVTRKNIYVKSSLGKRAIHGKKRTRLNWNRKI